MSPPARGAASAPPTFVIQGRRLRLRVGGKTIVAGVFAVMLIVIGIVVSPSNGWLGALVGVSGVLGALLGVLVQPEPIPKNYIAEASAAVRGLLELSDSLDSAQRMATQLAADADTERMAIALVTLQDDIGSLQVKIGRSMAEWDTVAPGATDEVDALLRAGTEAFAKLNGKVST